MNGYYAGRAYIAISYNYVIGVWQEPLISAKAKERQIRKPESVPQISAEQKAETRDELANMADKSLYHRLMADRMGKYEALILKHLPPGKWMTTNRLRTLIESKTGTSTNWYILHRALTRLEEAGKIESAKTDGLSLWRLKRTGQ